jgi:hypothetical protein
MSGQNFSGDADMPKAPTVTLTETGVTAVRKVTFTLDTAAYASGDLLADTQKIAGVVREGGGHAILQSMVFMDMDDTGGAVDVLFLKSPTSIGAENAALAMTDAVAANLLGVVSIATGDWYDVGASRVATKTNIGLVVEGLGRDIYVALVSKGTSTYTVNGIIANFAFLQD